jgi:hypothetical protein
MPSFENIHPSKFAAFLDGALTATLVLWLIKLVRKGD